MKAARSKVVAGLILFLAVAGSSFLLAPVKLAALALLGRSPNCPFNRAVDSAAHRQRLTEAKDRILAASRLLETDSTGASLWQTPRGLFWIPKGEGWGLPFNLAEQEVKLYGTGKQAVQLGDIVLDCGANIGIYTREALAEGAKLVVAIEPAPENIECLRRNLAAEVAAGRVIIYEKGVWDKDDFLAINNVPDNPAADTFVLDQKGAQTGPKLPLTTIDKLAGELRLERVDYIKMDIEGAEQRALKGAAQTLRRFHPRLSLSAYHLPDDPVRIPELVREAWQGYRMECGPCTYANGKIGPDVLYFQ
jgi:FkbM family methyltransferase